MAEIQKIVEQIDKLDQLRHRSHESRDEFEAAYYDMADALIKAWPKLSQELKRKWTSIDRYQQMCEAVTQARTLEAENERLKGSQMDQKDLTLGHKLNVWMADFQETMKTQIEHAKDDNKVYLEGMLAGAQLVRDKVLRLRVEEL